MVIEQRVQLLVDALESGEFSQGEGRLCSIAADGTRKWCCLGVGMIVAIRNGLDVEERIEKGHFVRFYDGNGPDHSATMLTERVAAWYGFASMDPFLISEEVFAAARHNHTNRNVSGSCDCASCLQVMVAFAPDPHGYPATTCNDVYRLTFTQIARAFRETYITNNPTEVNDEAA